MLYFWKKETNSNQTMLKKIVLLFLLIGVISACTKDDICTKETPTTPFLVIKFKSKINPLLSENVTNLTVTTIVNNDSIDIYKSQTIDSILIPLNTLANTTEYLFTENNTSSNPGNTDKVIFTYQADNIYINRACAFKAIFKELITQLEIVEGENWISEIEVNQSTVENEDETHVTIFH
jgi:hypothetical protein